VPGIELSPDALLQWRSFFYRDAQIHRLGVNLHQIPVNHPQRVPMAAMCPFARDGAMRVDRNAGDAPYYFPNTIHPARPDSRYSWAPIDLTLPHGTPKAKSDSLAGLVGKEKESAAVPPMQGQEKETKEVKAFMKTPEMNKPVADRKMTSLHELDPDADYKQVRVLYRETMSTEERENLHFNYAQGLKMVQYRDIIRRFMAQLWRVDPALAQGVLMHLYKGTTTTSTGLPLAALQPELTMKDIEHEAQNGDVAKLLLDRALGYTKQGPLAHVGMRSASEEAIRGH
jgi:catalase